MGEELKTPRSGPTRSRRVLKVLEWAEGAGRNELRLSDLSLVLGDAKNDTTRARTVAQLLVKEGHAILLAPGRYALIHDGQPTRPPLTAAERIAHWIGPDRVALAYASAMAAHGLGAPPTEKSRLYLLRIGPVTRLAASLRLDAKLVKWHVRALEDVEEREVGDLGRLNVRTRVRTLVDGCDQPHFSGGMVNVARYLAVVLKTNGPAEIAAAAQHESRVIAQRVGYLLDLAGAPPGALEPLRARARGSMLALDTTMVEEGPYERSWCLHLNVPPEALRAAVRGEA